MVYLIGILESPKYDANPQPIRIGVRRVRYWADNKCWQDKSLSLSHYARFSGNFGFNLSFLLYLSK